MCSHVVILGHTQAVKWSSHSHSHYIVPCFLFLVLAAQLPIWLNSSTHDPLRQPRYRRAANRDAPWSRKREDIQGPRRQQQAKRKCVLWWRGVRWAGPLPPCR